MQQFLSRDDTTYCSRAADILQLFESEEFSTHYLWTRFSRTPLFREEKMRHEVNIHFSHAGLATTVIGSFS